MYVYICNQILSYIEYVRVAHTCTEVLPYEGTVILPYFRTKISILSKVHSCTLQRCTKVLQYVYFEESSKYVLVRCRAISGSMILPEVLPYVYVVCVRVQLRVQ